MPGEPPPAAIAAVGVGHSFGSSRPALQDCSFHVPAGAVVALLGRNGAGKTTLLRMVVGLLRPDRGTLRVFGRPVDADVLPHIGYVAQQPSLYRI
jgi:ABC-2 type transport system ATP-binding protein